MDDPKLPAPDSMTLRKALVARIKPDHPKPLRGEAFKTAQKAMGSLRRARRTLQRLGFEFCDLPHSGDL